MMEIESSVCVDMLKENAVKTSGFQVISTLVLLRKIVILRNFKLLQGFYKVFFNFRAKIKNRVIIQPQSNSGTAGRTDSHRLFESIATRGPQHPHKREGDNHTHNPIQALVKWQVALARNGILVNRILETATRLRNNRFFLCK